MNRNRSGRRYDREFKNNAVALVRGGRTITEVARDLGVSKWSLGHWVRQAEEGIEELHCIHYLHGCLQSGATKVLAFAGRAMRIGIHENRRSRPATERFNSHRPEPAKRSRTWVQARSGQGWKRSLPGRDPS
jgi:hypothetical protein